MNTRIFLAAVLSVAFVGEAHALDYSANKPTLPNVGANFGGTGPYANYVLLSTVPATLRQDVEIQNQSTGQIVFVMDDGTAVAGAAPLNATVDALAAASVTGGQGGSWESHYEVGRVQIYAPSSSVQVSVRTR